MNTLTEAELGYLAGLIDGEGCINISLRNGRTHALQVITAQTNKYLLQYWKDKTGLGTVHVVKHTNAGPNTNKRWSWNCSPNQSAELLGAIYPFLVLKKEEARVALEFVDVCKQQRSQFHGKGVRRITPHMFTVRQMYKDTLHALKRRRGGAELESPLEVDYEVPPPPQMALF